MDKTDDYTIYVWHYRFLFDGRQVTRERLTLSAMALDTIISAINIMRPSLKRDYKNPLCNDFIVAVRYPDFNILYWEEL